MRVILRIAGNLLLVQAFLMFMGGVMGDPAPARTPEELQMRHKALNEHMGLAGILGINGIACLIFPWFRKRTR